MVQAATGVAFDDVRDNLWEECYKIIYYTTFDIELSEAVGARWDRINVVTGALTALTASSSAVAGWALWSSGSGKSAWTVLAGVAALLSIVHNVLQVPTKIRNQEEKRTQLIRLRESAEQFKQALIFATVGGNEAVERFNEIRREYSELTARWSPDLATTRKLRVRVQDEVDVHFRS